MSEFQPPDVPDHYDEPVAHTWNHRLIEYVDTDGEPWFAIHEVHYEDQRPRAYTENPIAPTGSTIEQVRETLQRMLRCLDKPTLKETDFTQGSDTAVRVERAVPQAMPNEAEKK